MAGLQEDTRVNRGVVVAWGVTIVSVVTFCGWLGVRLVHARVHGDLAVPTGGPGQAPRFGVLEQTQFGEPAAGAVQFGVDKAYLEGWGWLDDAHGHAHVPIARAEQLLLAQHGGADAGRQ